MANFVSLAAARNWWGGRHGVDVEAHGLASLPPPQILSSGYLHPSAVRAVGMLGLGRGNIRRLGRDAVGRLNLDALSHELSRAGPAIVIANAGEVNAGDFDPIADVAELCEQHDAWLHVDGAFGLFARVSPKARSLTEGSSGPTRSSQTGTNGSMSPTTAGSRLCDRPSGCRER